MADHRIIKVFHATQLWPAEVHAQEVSRIVTDSIVVFRSGPHWVVTRECDLPEDTRWGDIVAFFVDGECRMHMGCHV